MQTIHPKSESCGMDHKDLAAYHWADCHDEDQDIPQALEKANVK